MLLWLFHKVVDIILFAKFYLAIFRHDNIKQMEVLVPDSLVEQIVNDVLAKVSTGSSSEGKIFVFDVAGAYDIGTKETGNSAL
jgi:nitrogen regulatory protein P-II 1